MGNFVDRLIMSVGFMLYLFDCGSDIYVAYQYQRNNEDWWFGMTIGLIVVPSMVVNITAIIEYTNISVRYVLAVLQLFVVVGYIEALKWLDPYDIYFLAKLRYMETIAESAPQWCLQVYIMLRQWSFPSYTVVSTVLSFLSLAWSIRILEKQRKLDQEEDHSLRSEVLFLIWQLSTLVSRLSAIVIVAYLFRYYVIVFLAVHWLLVTTAMLIIQRKESYGGKCFKLSCLAGYPSLFHSSETVLATAKPKVEMFVGNISIIIENIACLVVVLTIDIPHVQHMDVLKPVAISCIVGGTVLSGIFLIIYNQDRTRYGEDLSSHQDHSYNII